MLDILKNGKAEILNLLFQNPEREYYYSEIGTYSVSGNKLNATVSDGYSYTETFIVSNNTLILIDEFGYSKRFTMFIII